MTYRKFKADQIFTGTSLLGSNSVLITTLEGRVHEIIPATEAGEDVQELKGILSPGFVNAHCHLELSHMKGRIAPGSGMVDFLLGVMKQRNFPADEVQSAIADAEDEMWNNGITAVGDICNTPDTIAQKTKSKIVYRNFVETMGFIPATASQRFAFAKSVYDQFENALPSKNSIVPHAPYSVSPALLQLIADFPNNHFLSIHNQESEAEAQFLKDGTGDMLKLYAAIGIDLSFYKPSGLRSPQLILPSFHKNQQMILVHDVHTSAADIQWMQAAEQLQLPALYFCVCPNANLYIGNGLPDIELLRKQGADIVLGTDSLTSNHQLNILEEIKTIAAQYPEIALHEMLQWATLNGARALGFDSQLGSFEKGKQPGVVLIENAMNDIGEASAKRIL